jgi:hypothetical protein
MRSLQFCHDNLCAKVGFWDRNIHNCEFIVFKQKHDAQKSIVFCICIRFFYVDFLSEFDPLKNYLFGMFMCFV